MENKVLKEIKDYYIGSSDFNGLPFYKLDKKDIDTIKNLINKGDVECISAFEDMNPYIKRLDILNDKEEQIESLENYPTEIVLYPSKKYLETLGLKDEKPFTSMLLNGDAQLKIVFFKLEILEHYFRDPRFNIKFHDCIGNIYLEEKFIEADYKYIKDFGIGYLKEDSKVRCVGVFLRDLSSLSLEEQMRWQLYMLKKQESYCINYPFIEMLILGKFTEKVSIYDAILDEVKIINQMCTCMGIPKLFKKEFGSVEYERPEDFRIIFLPTLKNYYEFLMTVEKMFVDNINTKTFTVNVYPISSIDPKQDDGRQKGSLNMFSEWMKKNIRTSADLEVDIMKILKDIRKERQKPAHGISVNEYSTELYEKQNNLIINLYKSIRNIRLLFKNHPMNQDIEINEYLITGKNIELY